MPVSITGDGAVTVLASIASPTTLSGLTIPTTGFGKVLQIGFSRFTTATSATAPAYTGLQVAMTPTSTASRFLVICSINNSTSGSGRAQFYVRHNSTSGDNSGTLVGNASTWVGYGTASGISSIYQSPFVAVTDAIGTTAQQFFKLIYEKHDGGTVYMNQVAGESTMVVVEVGA